MNAIKRNSLGKLNINAGQGTMEVTVPGAGTVGALETLPSGVSFNTSTPGNIIFDSLGRLNTSAKTVILESTSGNQKTVTISATGKITINNMS